MRLHRPDAPDPVGREEDLRDALEDGEGLVADRDARLPSMDHAARPQQAHELDQAQHPQHAQQLERRDVMVSDVVTFLEHSRQVEDCDEHRDEIYEEPRGDVVVCNGVSIRNPARAADGLFGVWHQIIQNTAGHSNTGILKIPIVSFCYVMILLRVKCS